MPIGFKNGTDGGVQIALDAVAAASAPQSFLGIGADGRASLVSTLGNPDVSLILRGGADGPNWETPHVRAAAPALEDRGVLPRLTVAASASTHGKEHAKH